MKKGRRKNKQNPLEKSSNIECNMKSPGEQNNQGQAEHSTEFTPAAAQDNQHFSFLENRVASAVFQLPLEHCLLPVPRLAKAPC